MARFTREEILGRLRGELETILGHPVGAPDAGRPLHELGVDSIGLVEILVMIEREFGQSLLDSGLAAGDFQSLDRIASLVFQRQA